MTSARKQQASERPGPPVGSRIADARKRTGLTQAQLAERAGVSRSTIAHVERGAWNCGLGVLVAVADALGCTTDSLLGRGP